MAYCEQCTNEGKYSVGEISLCEPCYQDYMQEHEDEARKEAIEHAEKYGREIDVWEAKNVE